MASTTNILGDTNHYFLEDIEHYIAVNQQLSPPTSTDSFISSEKPGTSSLEFSEQLHQELREEVGLAEVLRNDHQKTSDLTNASNDVSQVQERASSVDKSQQQRGIFPDQTFMESFKKKYLNENSDIFNTGLLFESPVLGTDQDLHQVSNSESFESALSPEDYNSFQDFEIASPEEEPEALDVEEEALNYESQYLNLPSEPLPLSMEPKKLQIQVPKLEQASEPQEVFEAKLPELQPVTKFSKVIAKRLEQAACGDKHINGFLTREQQFQSDSHVKRLVAASEKFFAETRTFSNIYELMKAFSVCQPQVFVQKAFDFELIDFVEDLYSTGRFGNLPQNYPLKSDDFYSFFIISKFEDIAVKQFGHLNFASSGKAASANKNFSKYRYFKGTSATPFPFVYENISREKLGNILEISCETVAEIETFIEDIADKLCISINGDRVPNKKTTGASSQPKIKKQTWNKKPAEVKNLLYGVVSRALFMTFGFDGSIIELFVKKIASNVAQNNFKRLEKSRGAIDGKVNKVYRRNNIHKSSRK